MLHDLPGATPADPGDRTRLLIGHIARRMAEELRDLLRVTVADSPGGAPREGGLHLLGRDIMGITMRASLLPGSPRGPRTRYVPSTARPCCASSYCSPTTTR